MGDPEFSIVIPTYNRAGSVGDTLKSCWQQTFTDFEILLVDDGSTDNTESVVSGITDPRFNYVYQQNGGPAKARNAGTQRARGSYIAFLDSDDVWLPNHLANAQKYLVRSEANFLYSQIIVDRGVGRYWLKPNRGINPGENIFDYLYVHGGFIQTSTIVITKALSQQVQWDESLTFGDNDQYAIDLWKAGAKPIMLPHSQTLYADHMSSDALSQLPIFSGGSKKHTNFLDWMDKQTPHMSEQARLAFAARFASVALAREAPAKSLAIIWRAFRSGAMSFGGACRQLMQSFSPRLYRKFTDQFVRLRGSTDIFDKSKL